MRSAPKTSPAVWGGKRLSAAKMPDALIPDGLIPKESYGKVQFTGDGLTVSNRLYTSYLLLHNYFIHTLRMPASKAAHDAQVCVCHFSEEGLEFIFPYFKGTYWISVLQAATPGSPESGGSLNNFL